MSDDANSDPVGGLGSASWKWDVCIVGTGRVGLPLALSLIEEGVRVTGVDRDGHLRDAVNAGRMPFHEPGYDDLVAQKRLKIVEGFGAISESKFVVITVGTPLRGNIETDMRQLNAALDSVIPELRAGQLLSLRSTISPRTTRMVARRVQRESGLEVGKDIGVAYCPERIAEGLAYAELRSLPQVVGSEDALSAAMADELYEVLAPEVLHTSAVNAEFLKLFTNIERYVHFGLANQFALVADTHGGNIHEIRRLSNYRYPRNHIATPGFTAGTCLRKDFGMISEWSPYIGIPLAAWKVNESMPAFLVRHMEKRIPLLDRRVALLGFSFKAESDDTRDSLSPKLYRYLQRECPSEIRVNDPYLPDPIADAGVEPLQNHGLAECLDGVDCVFVAMNHRQYRAALAEMAESNPETWIADLWNCGGCDQLFYQAGDLRDLA